ncbi:MAG: hypothetical protein WA152_01715 [Microgenomates group bacterium]
MSNEKIQVLLESEVEGYQNFKAVVIDHLTNHSSTIKGGKAQQILQKRAFKNEKSRRETMEAIAFVGSNMSK